VFLGIHNDTHLDKECAFVCNGGEGRRGGGGRLDVLEKDEGL
jgi:hypothetical protein